MVPSLWFQYVAFIRAQAHDYGRRLMSLSETYIPASLNPVGTSLLFRVDYYIVAKNEWVIETIG